MIHAEIGQKKPALQQTWTNFKIDMAKAYHERREMTGTAAQYGYGNCMRGLTDEESQDDPIDELANLARGVNEDRTLVRQLTEQNKKLLEQLETITKKLAEQPVKPKRKPRRKYKSYCWTHGFWVGPGHDSKTCTSKGVGQKDEATPENRMGGNTNGLVQYNAQKQVQQE